MGVSTLRIALRTEAGDSSKKRPLKVGFLLVFTLGGGNLLLEGVPVVG